MNVVQLWWLSLGLAGVVVAVVALLLGLIVAAAKRIERHADNIWTVGKQIAGNTVSIWMLRQTNASLEQTARAALSIERSARSIETILESGTERSS